MACMKRTLIWSDVHLSDRSVYESGRSWFRPDVHLARQVRFLDRHVLSDEALASGLERVVLLGDVFDSWIVPIGLAPPTYRQIMASNADVIERLAQAVRLGVEVVVVPGNHDFDLSAQELERAIPGARLVSSITLGASGIALHGHERSLFNTAAYFEDQQLYYPVGYYFSRVASTIDAAPASLHSARALARYIRDGALASLWREDFMRQVMSVVFPALGASADDEIVMPGERVLRLSEVVSSYGLVARCLPPAERVARMVDRFLKLVRTAHHLHASHDLVVLGHVHEASLRRRRDGGVTINTGAWCQDDAHVVELSGPSRDALTCARLLGVDDEARLFEVASAPLC